MISWHIVGVLRQRKAAKQLKWQRGQQLEHGTLCKSVLLDIYEIAHFSRIRLCKNLISIDNLLTKLKIKLSLLQVSSDNY